MRPLLLPRDMCDPRLFKPPRSLPVQEAVAAFGCWDLETSDFRVLVSTATLDRPTHRPTSRTDRVIFFETVIFRLPRQLRLWCLDASAPARQQLQLPR